MRSSAAQNILLLMWERDVSAREFLAGFAHYSNSRPNWCVRLLHAADALVPSTVQDVVSGKYDGLVLTDSFLSAHPEFGSNPSTAVAVIGERDADRRPPIGRSAFVGIDNTRIGRFGARHLMSLGKFNAYAFIPPPVSEAWDRQRATGFCRELAAKGLSGSVYDRVANLADWLRALPKPAAIMAACDYTAVGVMTTCSSIALRIPQDVSILGVDNDELLCEFTQPSLTSIQPEHFENGFKTALALNGLLQGKRRPHLPPKIVSCSGIKLVERESTRYLSPALHLVRSALAYIKANVSREISVANVVDHLGVSRRLADLRFREYHDKSIHETIVETKLSELASRLLTTRLSVSHIAAALGFQDLSYLGRLFRRRYGMTMTEWRIGGEASSKKATPPQPTVCPLIRKTPHSSPSSRLRSRPRP